MMKRYLPRNMLCVCAGILLLSGCAGTSPQVDFYTLSAMPSSAGQSQTVCKNMNIGIGPVSWPRFLDRSQIVTRSGQNKLVFDEFNRWGGSLRQDFSRVMVQNLSLLLEGSNIIIYPQQAGISLNYRVELDIQQFDGRLDESVLLLTRWVIRAHDDKMLASAVSNIQQTVSGDDYESFVASQSEALATLSQEIATAMAGVCARPES